MEFEELFEQYINRVYRFTYIKIFNKEDVEDICSIIFEKIYLNLDKFSQNKGSLESWIFTIARNEIASYYRKRKIKTVNIDEASNISCGHDLDTYLDSKIINQNLMEALKILNENELFAIACKYGGDLKNTEIAELMNISTSNVGVVLYRSMRKLKIKLEV